MPEARISYGQVLGVRAGSQQLPALLPVPQWPERQVPPEEQVCVAQEPLWQVWVMLHELSPLQCKLESDPTWIPVNA